jgi:hypothetical protein
VAARASFVPALIVTEGGPPPFATTYVPLFVYRNAFEYLRYGYAARGDARDVPRHGRDRVRAVPDRPALAPFLRAVNMGPCD